MDTAALIDELDLEGRRLVALCAGDLGRPVPTCAPWALRDLSAHVGYVHRWAGDQVANARRHRDPGKSETDVLATAPPDPEMAGFVAEGHRSLVAALRAAPAALGCWTLLPATTPLAFWARRQLHETTVHRVDAELALGATSTPLRREVATDELDELLCGFLPRRRAGAEGRHAALTFAPSDGEGRWSVRIDSDGAVRAVSAALDADVVIAGTAADLPLGVEPPAEVRLSGDEAALRRYAERCRVVWTS